MTNHSQDIMHKWFALMYIILPLCLFSSTVASQSPELDDIFGNQITPSDSFFQQSDSSENGPFCSSDGEFNVLTIPEKKSYVICASTNNCQLKISKLIMEKASAIILPPACNLYDIQIGTAILKGQNLILSDRGSWKETVHDDGSNIVLKIDQADLLYNKVSTPISEKKIKSNLTEASILIDLGTTTSTQKYPGISFPNPESGLGFAGLVVLSAGGIGEKGKTGTHGRNANISCSGAKTSPKDGGDGGTGTDGHQGGTIKANIVVSSYYRKTGLSNNDITLLSLGGMGGAGGLPGKGGKGVKSLDDCALGTYKIGGFTDAKDGKPGKPGNSGAAGNIVQTISVE